MRRILTSAVALAMLVGGPALAQGGKQDRNDARPEKAAKPDKGPAPDRSPNRPNPNASARPDQRGSQRPDSRPNDNRPNRPNDNRPNRPDNNRPDNNRPNANRPNDNRPNNYRPDRNRPNVNQNRARPRTFDRRAYQRNANAARKFRGGYYRKPAGWYYRRWTFGQILPFAFFARDYWLNDYYAYDLPLPPYGYEWVRYGDDALLVDTRTGTILQVQYGVFY